MSAVNITDVTVLGNPAPFLNPLQFEISYECLVPLKDGNLSVYLPQFPHRCLFISFFLLFARLFAYLCICAFDVLIFVNRGYVMRFDA